MTAESVDSRASQPAVEPTDHSLLRRVREGCQDSASKLYLRYFRRLYALAKARCSPALARRLDPDDIVQSVFHRFFHHASNGDYDVPRGEDLWKLFLVIALNKIRTAEEHHRAGKRDVARTVGESAARELEAPGKPDAEGFLRLTVAEALEQLPPQHRRMVELRVEGYEVSEIAQQTGRSKRTVERILQEARAKLHAFFHG